MARSLPEYLCEVRGSGSAPADIQAGRAAQGALRRDARRAVTKDPPQFRRLLGTGSLLATGSWSNVPRTSSPGAGSAGRSLPSYGRRPVPQPGVGVHQ